jgi:lipoate-protein ligase B
LVARRSIEFARGDASAASAFRNQPRGQATYHGPGQLIGYFLIDLRRYGQDLHRYLRWMKRCSLSCSRSRDKGDERAA